MKNSERGEVVMFLKERTMKTWFQRVCAYCGKRKRGWRAEYEETLCSECEKKVRQ